MPGVNGHVVSSPALHASRSISSFAPATRTFGWLASIATAGSFCLFCANGEAGLPALTLVSVPTAVAGRPLIADQRDATTISAPSLRIVCLLDLIVAADASHDAV